MTGMQLSQIPRCLLPHVDGIEPVRDWLKGLPEEDRHTVGVDLATVANRLACWNAAMPFSWRRVMGSAQQFAKPPDRASSLLRS